MNNKENFDVPTIDTSKEIEKTTINRCILSEPVKHSLIDIFKELKFGRVVEDQRYLQKCIEELSNS